MADVGDVRRIALSLPYTSEVALDGESMFVVGERSFASVRAGQTDVLAVSTRREPETWVLLAAEPDVFFAAPQYSEQGMLLVRISAISVDELAEVLTWAWCSQAPAAIRAEFEGSEL
jgi:hypothetical protein